MSRTEKIAIGSILVGLVVLALKGPPLAVSRRALFDRAMAVERRFGLPARGWVKAMRL